LRSGFPHSDISGSKLHCQLPRAFRRLVRPSSPVIAKASTTCTYSLDPITLSSPSRTHATDHSFRAPPATGGSMQSQPYRQCPLSGTSAIQPSSIFLKSTDPIRGQACRVDRPSRPDTSSLDGWWRMTGSNRRPPACKAGALPAELIPRCSARNPANPYLYAIAIVARSLPSIRWWVWLESNQRPSPYQDDALTD
jgi:hypothetical protein